jgi:Ca-activated chloride channel family protein
MSEPSIPASSPGNIADGCSPILPAFASVVVVTGQKPAPSATPPDDVSKPIAVRTDLVTLTLTVTDLYGRYVSGLSKNAFTIMDNNKEQEVTFFSDSDAPVSVGILFDVSGR